MTASLDSLLRHIVEAGIAAPSADNEHRWRVSVASERRIRIVGPDVSPKLPAQSRLLFLISFGAVLENIRLSALARGLSPELLWIDDPGSERPAVDIVFEVASEPRDPLVDAIPVRHTNRSLMFRGPGLTASEKLTIEAAARNVDGCTLSWLDDKQRRTAAARLSRAAETERFRVRDLHTELFSCVRFDLGWSTTCDRGLPPGTLGVEAPLRAPFRWLSQWRVMRSLNLLGAHHGLGFRSAGLPIHTAPNVAALSAGAPFPWGALEGGRAMQRVWLALTLRGMAVQVFAASALYSNDANTDVRKDLQQALAHGWRKLLPPGHTAIMLFRIGRAAEPAVRTARPPAESLLNPESVR